MFVALAPIARMANTTNTDLKKFASGLSFIEMGLEFSHLWKVFSDKQKKYVDFDGIANAFGNHNEATSHSDLDAK